MPELVTLTEDGPLGKAGTQVWVDDAKQAPKAQKVTPKKAAKALKTTRKPVDQI